MDKSTWNKIKVALCLIYSNSIGLLMTFSIERVSCVSLIFRVLTAPCCLVALMIYAKLSFLLSILIQAPGQNLLKNAEVMSNRFPRAFVNGL